MKDFTILLFLLWFLSTTHCKKDMKVSVSMHTTDMKVKELVDIYIQCAVLCPKPFKCVTKLFKTTSPMQYHMSGRSVMYSPVTDYKGSKTAMKKKVILHTFMKEKGSLQDSGLYKCVVFYHTNLRSFLPSDYQRIDSEIMTLTVEQDYLGHIKRKTITLESKSQDIVTETKDYTWTTDATINSSRDIYTIQDLVFQKMLDLQNLVVSVCICLTLVVSSIIAMVIIGYYRAKKSERVFL